jgi:hypothetical protein
MGQIRDKAVHRMADLVAAILLASPWPPHSSPPIQKQSWDFGGQPAPIWHFHPPTLFKKGSDPVYRKMERHRDVQVSYTLPE